MASDAASLSSARAKSNSGARMNRRVGPLEPEEARVLPHRGAGDEVELVPEAVELAPARLVEHQLIERGVVAEVARHAVKAGAEQPARVPLLLLRVEIDAGPLRHEEGVGEGRAEPREGRPCTARHRPDPGSGHGPGSRGPGVRPVRPDLRRAHRRNASGSPRTGGSSRGRAVCEPLWMPGAVRFLTSGTSCLRSPTTKSRIRSQPARGASALLVAQGRASSRHSACTAAIGPTSSAWLGQGPTRSSPGIGG